MKVNFKTGGRGKVTVFIDGEQLAAVDEDFALSCGYKDNDEIDGAQLTAFTEAVRLRSAFLGAMRLISLRDHGKKELENKLCQKGHKREIAHRVCDMLEEKGYIDDEAYAVSLAQRLSESKGYSVSRIKSELYLKGISRDAAENACEMLDNEPVLRIIEILNAKYAGRLSTEKELKKAISALQRMGYRYSDIRSALCQLDESVPMED